MPTHADKAQENKTRSVANAFAQKQSGAVSPFEWVDMRPKALAQRELQEMSNNSRKVRQLSAWQEMADEQLPHSEPSFEYKKPPLV